MGIVESNTEHSIFGRSGEHLQFYEDIRSSLRYQVDVNIQSKRWISSASLCS